MSEPATPPNVVLILADDLGWGDLGCYGATRIDTPNIDALAAKGVRALDAHSSSAVCTPSRYGVLTGRYSWRGPLKSGVLGPFSPPIIESDRTTIASLLRDGGYRTGAFGKWHLGLGWTHTDGSVSDAFSSPVEWDPLGTEPDIDFSVPVTGGPLELGFDRFFGTASSLDMPPYCFIDQDRPLGSLASQKQLVGNQRPGLAADDWVDSDVDVRVTQQAVDWLETAGTTPFFLYLATAAPHRPNIPPAFAAGSSRAGVRGDCVSVVDWVVGQVVETLERLGMLDNTLLIVTSDNGAPTRFPEEGDPAHSPNGPWRGQKADIWEGGHREPFVVQWPRGIPRPGVIEQPVSLTDLLPTIAEATGRSLPERAAEDGRSILGLLRRAAGDGVERTLVHHSNDGSFGVRRGRFKAVFSTGSGGFSEPVGHSAEPPQRGALFDLAADPGEQNDLWDALPELVAELHAALEAERSRP
jgi:arylsulfatase A